MMLSKNSFLVLLVVLTIGCGDLQNIDPKKPKPTPDTPINLKVPDEAIFKGLATWVNAKRLDEQRELAEIVNQLVKAKVLTSQGASLIEEEFPGYTTSSKALTPADSEKLRSIK